MRTTRIGSGRQAPVLASLMVLWLALTGLLLASRGNPQTFLLANLGRHVRADAFNHLISALPPFWLVHSSLVLMAVAAARSRRSDVLTVLLIGPALALAFNLFDQDWSDPNWDNFVAVSFIGWLVSTVVRAVYWGQKPTA